MMPPHCAPERALDRAGHVRHCILSAGHDGDHMDAHGDTWEQVPAALARIQAAWGSTHRVVFLPSGMWLATAHSPDVPWRTETEPTAEQLEEKLLLHNPTLPRSDRMTATLVRTRTVAPTVPAPRTATPPPSTPTAAMCGMCNGQGGSWTTSDGGTPGKNIGRWVPCTGCGGTGKV